MFPLSDQSHPRAKRHTPAVTLLFVLVNVAAFLWMLATGFERAIFEYGFTPARFLSGEAPETLVTSMFLHGGIGHIAGNLWFLWVFGDNVEFSMGWLRYALFYLLAGVAAVLAFLLFADDLSIPLVGASGAISGVLGAYARLFPRNRVKGIVFFFYFLQVIVLPASVYVGLWFVYQLLLIGTDTPVAYMAHIGGFVLGLLAAPLFVRRNLHRPQWEYVSPAEK